MSEDDPMLCTVLTWVRHIEENYLFEVRSLFCLLIMLITTVI